MALGTRVSVVLASVALLGCGRGTELARDVELSTARTPITFAAPVIVAPGARTFCFEFDPPGDSRAAGELDISLVDSAGRAEEFHGTPDRTGEATVCLRDSVGTRRVYAGATIASRRRLTVRSMSWIAPREARGAP